MAAALSLSHTIIHDINSRMRYREDFTSLRYGVSRLYFDRLA